MYLPRQLISTLYLHLKNTRHTLSPPVQILVALEPDALCACRILTHLLKRDYIPHKIQPISGYADLELVGNEHVKPMMESQGGSGGLVICLGVGGLVDLAALMGLEDDEESAAGFGGVEIWLIDARRPWNLANVFGVPVEYDDQGEPSRIRIGVDAGRIERGYKPGRGGVIVFDDGDIDEELGAEKEAYLELLAMGMNNIEDDGEESDESESEDDEEDDAQDKPETRPGKKRKSWSDREEDEEFSDDEDDRPRQRRRSNSSSPILDSPRRPQQRGLLSLAHRTVADSRSISPTPGQPPKPESARKLRRRALRKKRKYEAVLQAYYSLGTSYSEPISSMMYSLASELGREDNDLLWLTIVGVTSMEMYGRSSQGVAVISRKSSEYPTQSTGWLGMRGAQLWQLLRDEVRRLNPPELSESSSLSNRNFALENSGIIPTTARSPTDTCIRLSPEPKLLMIRHWSLYDSMLHSPYLAARLRIWSEGGRKRLNKFLAKMGVSIVQSKQSYTHMDMEVKRGLREKLLKYSAVYGLDDLVPASGTERSGGSKEGWGFVRSWGWRATLSAHDVSTVIGSVLEVGLKPQLNIENGGWSRSGRENIETTDTDGTLESREWQSRFYHAYDALEKIEDLKAAVPIAQHLHRSILRTGTALIEKKAIRDLHSFRFSVVKDGPDVALFTHPSALTKLALWIGEAIMELDHERKGGKLSHGGRGTPLAIACLNETRGVYVVVGTGGGGNGLDLADKAAIKARKADREAKAKEKAGKKKAEEEAKEAKRRAKAAARRRLQDDDDDDELETESEASESDTEDEDEEDVEEEEKSLPRGYGRNRFGNAFQEVVEMTNARVRIDSFEHCVVDVKMEDLQPFLASLSQKMVVG